MKKKRLTDHLARAGWTKLLRVMKLTAFLVLILVLDVSASLYSQNSKVSVKVENGTLSEIFSKIETQSEYRFFYQNEQIRDVERKSIDVSNKNTLELVSDLLGNTGLTYKLVDRNIIIFPSNEKNNMDNAFQQPKSISGKVTDTSGASLPGVTVAIKGTTTGTITDANGSFNFQKVTGEATLVFSFVGLKTQEVNVAGKSTINVVMQEETVDLAEVVAVGYLSQKKSLLTGSVETMVMTDKMRIIPSASAGNILTGRLAGVNVGTPSGLPGEQPSISVRKGSSWNNQNVLYVIDGVVKGGGDFNNLAPNEIETITVLKDAAAAAVYGSRAAGGVILVTTRRGEVGKMKIDYSYSYGEDTRTKNAQLTSAVDLGKLYNRMLPSSNSGYYTPEDFAHLQTINNGWGYDQLGEVWTNPTTKTQNFGVSGGTDKIKYFAGLSNIKQSTFVKAYGYDKTNVRFNTTVNVTKDLQFFAGMGLTNRDTESDAFGGPSDLYKKLLVWQPWQPVYTDGGKYITTHWIGNIGAEAKNESGYTRTNDFKPDVNLNLVYKIPFIKGLTAKAAYAVSVSNSHYSEFRKKYQMAIMKESANGHIISTNDADITGWDTSSNWYPPYLYKKATWSRDKQLNFQMNYDHTFGKHSVSGVFAYEASESGGSGVYGGRERVPVYLTDQFWAFSSARADTWSGGDTDWVSGRKSFIGQTNYSYDNKYLFSASFREDGSMNFASDQRWGFFPAVSAGWVISEEDFFGTAKDIFNRVKLRASAGLTGNDAVGGWQWQESYQTGNKAFFGEGGNTISQGIKYGNIVNKNITWEKSLSYNFAVDMEFCKHWNSTIEYYIQDTYDILGSRNASVPTSFSGSLPAENYGEIKAHGVDFNIEYKNIVGALNYYVKANVSHGWNKVITQDYALNTQEVNIPVGKSTNRITGFKFEQILRTQDQLDAFNIAHPGYKVNGWAPQLGMMTYKDLSGPNGVPDNTINDYDKVDLVKDNTPVYFGFTLGGDYKGFSLQAVFSGSAGSKKSYQDVTGNVEWNRMYQGWVNDSWIPENPNATLPQALPYYSSASTTYRDVPSDFWLKKNDFIRLSYLNIGYDFKQLGLKGVNSLKLYVTGSNLFSIGSFKYWDPQGSAFGYPIMKSFNIGINVGF